MSLKERKEKIKEAFKDFRAKGIRAKYCESNVWKFIQEHENSVAYTKYDLEAMERTNSIQFTWKGDGEKIFNILKEHFEIVKWDGTIFSTMKVKF